MAIQGTSSPSFFHTSPSANRVSHQRWVICGLLFLATVIAYIDRGVIAYLEKSLETIFPGLNSVKYGYITAAFQAAYAIGMVVAGGLTDKLGTRKAFAIAIGLWSIAAMLPGAAISVVTFGIAMFLLGLGEAANFPACIKTVAEWFPKRERALATGIFNSGANFGNIAVPLVVPALITLFSGWSLFGPKNAWRGAFVATGAAGLIWLVAWLVWYRRPDQHHSVSKAELDLILSDPLESAESIPWSHVLPRKETWAFAIGKFLTGPHLVVLSLLAAGLPAIDLQPQPFLEPAATGRCLRHFNRRQHRRRVDFLTDAQRRQKRQCFPQDGHADLRALRRSGLRRAVHS